MSGVSDTPTDAAMPEGSVPPPRPVIPWTFGFSPLLFLGDCVRFFARHANRETLS